MIRNYLTTAIRNLQRNKFYTIINVLGLAVGVACFILIMLYVQDEMNYDRYHTKADRIYRLVEKIELEGQGEESSSNPFPVAPTLKNDYPELIEHTVRFFNFQVDKRTLKIGDEKFAESQVFFADSNVFEVFDFPLIKGNPQEALDGPNLIVISQELGEKYFGEGVDPMGKIIEYEGIIPLKVSGIFDEIPQQSHFQLQALISFPTLKPMIGKTLTDQWVWNPNWTYILLAEDASPQELEDQFPIFIDKYYPNFIKTQITHYLQPLTDIHLRSKLDYEIEPNSSETTIYIFLIIGVFILLIACINFMNLATARSAKRAQEVGMRKVLGAHKHQLVRQFIGESIVMSFLSLLVALFLISIALPIFNQISGKNISQDLLLAPQFLMILIAIGIVVGVISGLYPAFYLSSFLPVKVLKGKLKSSRSNALFRKGLVIIQFSISLILIISTVIIYQQFNFMRSADIGFNKDQIIVIPTKQEIIPKLDFFREEILRNPSVKNMTTMNEIIGTHHNVHEYNYEGMEPKKWIYFPSLIVDEDFVKTFDLNVVAGRDFSRAISTEDTSAIIINETMVEHLGWGTPQEALGKRFNTIRGSEIVVGVIKDFHFVSLKDKIRPFVLDITPKETEAFFTKNIAVSIAPENTEATIAHLDKVWTSMSPDHPFDYSFLDAEIDKLYRDESQLGDLVGYFSLLAIFIACLGLFALASFTAEQRTKEIGIRKVLGATMYEIIQLLATDFMKLVLLSNLIAWPFAWWMMQEWLMDFAYHTEINWWIFAAAGIVVILISMFTVLTQAYKAGLLNPVMALREE